MSKYVDTKEFYKEFPDGRCKPCEYGRVVIKNGQMFLGCYFKPFIGKRTTDINKCPKQIKNILNK